MLEKSNGYSLLMLITISNLWKNPFKFIDLFAGIGGFRCALTLLGASVYNEWDKYASITYKSWFEITMLI